MRCQAFVPSCALTVVACAAPLAPAAPGQPVLAPQSEQIPAAATVVIPAAGSGGGPAAVSSSASAVQASAAASGSDVCPERFTVAARASVEMSWPETIGYLAGSGLLQTWSKITHTRSAMGTTVELMPCGVETPVVTTTLLLDSILLANEIPVVSFDRPSMPRFTGTSLRTADEQVIDVAAMALGARLLELGTAWPHRTELSLIDHDGDGKPGITAVPKNGGAFGLPPADVGLTERADEVYVASRIALRYRTRQALCEPRVMGTVEPLAFDYTIVGCHLQSGVDCKANQVNLLDNNDPAFMLGAQGRWVSVAVAETATCADVLAALPPE